MVRDQVTASGRAPEEREEGEEENGVVRDIYALTPPASGQQQEQQAAVVPVPAPPPRRREFWETGSHRSSNLSTASDGLGENFSTMSREFNALVLAGSAIDRGDGGGDGSSSAPAGGGLGRIGEELEETNPLAIVPDSSPMGVASAEPSSSRMSLREHVMAGPSSGVEVEVEAVSVQRVKKEEMESKIMAWQNAEIAKINNRFKRDDAIISGWEAGHVQKATAWFKKIERKLEEKRAKAVEKMQNDIAKARRKAEEKRASAEAKRGTKVAKVLDMAHMMRAMGRPPSKRSFF